MSNATPAPATTVSSARMITVLGGIAMLSGLLVVLTYQLTYARIEYNRQQLIERAVFKVLPGATAQKNFLVDEHGLRPANAGGTGIRIYAAYDGQDQLKGIATEAAARGYQDLVRILYGYDPACDCITGFAVLQSTETPGLGDKIVSDAKFLANFPLDAKLAGNGQKLANEIVTVKHGSKTDDWQIDAISGATITSVAVGKGLNNSAQRLLPLLQPHIDQLQEKN
ncbi:MAG: FMN-binding protein [Thiohalomonadaceae bacterium]